MNQPDPIKVINDVGRILSDLGIRFFVSGSIASSLYGEPRSTNDIDIVADLDEEDVRRAIERSSSFNIVHNETVQKVDIFVAGRDPHTIRELGRTHLMTLQDGSSIPLASREDLIFQKLVRYEKGDRVSDRQWRDVLGLLKGSEPDVHYLKDWAEQLGVADLLSEAFVESDLSDPGDER